MEMQAIAESLNPVSPPRGMKNFLYSFLGTIAGIWVTIILFSILMIVSIVIMAVSGASNSAENIRNNSILYIDLNGEIVEHPQVRDLWAEIRGEAMPSTSLSELVAVIDAAASDNKIKGIFIECNGAVAGAAQRQAIRTALKSFKEAAPDKWIYAYSDAYTQGDYFTACGADSLFINPEGIIDIHGLSATNLYFRNLLDKIGVKMQVIKVGTYKSAVEPYILDRPSEASVEQQKLFLDNMWGEICGVIAKERKTSTEKVNSWANSLLMASGTEVYLSEGIVDRAMYRHQFLDKLKKLTGRGDKEDLRLVTPETYARSASMKKRTGHAKIGVYYASGDITDTGDKGITAERMVADLLDLAQEDDLDALVIRVNSPGGSAFASEQIWEAVEQFKSQTGKPVYVSMSDYAASGGYYISCGADKIFAQPLTLTGSIGIFGLFPDAKELITDKAGVTSYTVSTNPDGELPTVFNPMTPAQQVKMQSYVNRGYELFVKRVADGRKLSVDSVKKIAEGRVWDGVEAHRRGLVDEIGGLDAALKDLAQSLNVESYELREYPSADKKWWELIVDLGSGMEARIEDKLLRRNLGEATQLYDALRTIGVMQPVQARMDFVTVNF